MADWDERHQPTRPENAQEQTEAKGKSSKGVSRRQFIKGSGLAVSAGVLVNEGLLRAAAPEKTPGVSGPGPVPVRLRINGEEHDLRI